MIILVLVISGSNSVKAGPLEDANKKLVVDFYTLAFGEHKPAEAAQKYIGSRYIQHNPRVPNGIAPFADYFEGVFKQNPDASSSIERVLADGDLVAIHSHSRMGDDDLGKAIVDIFRVADGKIVEHWDVMQDVIEPTVSGNTMFDGGID